jgi:hypothetical protein
VKSRSIQLPLPFQTFTKEPLQSTASTSRE